MTVSLLYLSSDDVDHLLPSPTGMQTILETMFHHKAAAQTDMPPKLGIHPAPDSFLHAMPASIPPLSAAGVKWVSAYPHNASRGLPQVCATIILNDIESGLPIAILDGALITAARTAAASALAARYLAKRDATTLAILGCGTQGRSHLRAFLDAFCLSRILAYDISSDALERYVQDMAVEHGVLVEPAASAEEAVTSCELIVTAGPITNPPHGTIQSGWVQPGAFAASIDYGSYWSPAALSEFNVLCTDDAAQYASHQSEGYLKGLPPIKLELADLVSGRSPGRTDSSQRALACNLGIAMEDIVVAQAVVDEAVAQGIGLQLRR